MSMKALSKAILAASLCSISPLFPCISPQTPVSITTDNSVNSFFLGLAGTPSGFVAGWRDTSNQAAASFSSDMGQTWSPPATFGTAVVSSVHLTAHSSNFLATWVQGTEATRVVNTSLSTNGVMWDPPVTVSTGMDVNFQGISAATDAGFMTVWTQIIGMNTVRTSFSSNGMAWNAPVSISTAFSPASIDVAGNDSGFMVAITHDDAVDNGYVSFSSDNGASWGPLVLVTTVFNETKLAIAANPSGFMTAWTDMTTRQVFTSFSTDDGQTWSTPVQVSTTPGDFNTVVNLGANDDVFTVIWVTSGNVPQASCSSDNGATWSSPFSFPSTAFMQSGEAAISGSNAMFAWRNGNNAVSSYSSVPFSGGGNGATPPASRPFFNQVSPNKPGKACFD